jgi:hypothetical protein
VPHKEGEVSCPSPPRRAIIWPILLCPTMQSFCLMEPHVKPCLQRQCDTLPYESKAEGCTPLRRNVISSHAATQNRGASCRRRAEYHAREGVDEGCRLLWCGVADASHTITRKRETKDRLYYKARQRTLSRTTKLHQKKAPRVWECPHARQCPSKQFNTEDVDAPRMGGEVP